MEISWTIAGTIIGAIALLGTVTGWLIKRYRQRLATHNDVRIKSPLRLRRATSLRDFFHGDIESAQLDLIIYPLSAKRDIPITDLIYIEFLRSMLRADRCRQVRIVLTYDVVRLTAEQADRFAERVRTLFGDDRHSVRIFNATQVVLESSGGLTPLFWKVLDEVGDPKYFRWVAQVANVRPRYLRQLVQGRPAGAVLRGIVRHASDTSFVIDRLLGQFEDFVRWDDRPFSLGVLVWEVEPDRLAIYRLVTQKDSPLEHFDKLFPDGIDLTALAGRTIKGRGGQPGENHDEDESIFLHDSIEDQLAAMKTKSTGELKAYSRALEFILSENYDRINIHDQLVKDGKLMRTNWIGRRNSPAVAIDVHTVPKEAWTIICGLNAIRNPHVPRKV